MQLTTTILAWCFPEMDHTMEDGTYILASEDDEHNHSAEEEKHTEVDFKSLVLKPKTFHQVIKSSGEIMPDKKDVIIIIPMRISNVLVVKQ